MKSLVFIVLNLILLQNQVNSQGKILDGNFLDIFDVDSYKKFIIKIRRRFYVW